MRARPRWATTVACAAALLHFLVPAPSHGDSAPASEDGKPDAAASAIQACVDDLSRWTAQHGGRLSASVVNVESGASLAAHAERTALNPASNMKVITAAVALDRLGPQYVYTTGVYGAVANGALDTLVLRGHGDPSLGSADLLRLARALVSQGVRRVARVQVDQSRFDDAYVPPAFEQQPNEWAAFRAPVSAVSLEQNTVTLNVAAAEPGRPARAWFDPPGFVELIGTIDTAPSGRGQNVGLTLEAGSPRLRARVSGHIAASLPRVRFRRRVDDPRLYPGYVLAALLRESGVDVGPVVELGGATERRLLSYIESAPLSVLVRELGKSSDNFYAETLLKTLGAETRGSPAKSSDGAAAVVEWLKSTKAADTGTRIVNGSGLFDANRVSARTLTTVLAHAYKSPRVGPEFVSQLAIGGVDGTLRSRFRNVRTKYLVRAKTGTLNAAVSLSGYALDAQGHPPAAFAFLVEGIKGKHGDIRSRIDACVERLVELRKN